MRRAILIALGIGFMVTSAAAPDIGSGRPLAPTSPLHDADMQAARVRDSARAQQRARIDERYAAERELCMALAGLRRDQCLVSAHAARGRAMLEAAAPYEARL